MLHPLRAGLSGVPARWIAWHRFAVRLLKSGSSASICGFRLFEESFPMSSFRTPGPVCFLAGQYEVDEGTLAVTASPAPGTIDAETAPPATPKASVAETEDEEEFKLLTTTIGICDNLGNEFEHAAAYVEYRTSTFGSETGYRVVGARADAELEQTEWKSGTRTIKLRQIIEFGRFPEAQKLFYRWVWKAYRDVVGETEDIPKLIRTLMTWKLLNSPKVIELGSDEMFQSGFNAAPLKFHGRYCLGTLGEKAFFNSGEEQSDPAMEAARSKKFSVGIGGNGVLLGPLVTDGSEFYYAATFYDRTAVATAARKVEVEVIRKAGFDVPGQLEAAKRTEKNLKAPPVMDVTVVFGKGARGETATIKGRKGTRIVTYDLERDAANFIGDDSSEVMDRHTWEILAAIAAVL
jgi:hypothetical protein